MKPWHVCIIDDDPIYQILAQKFVLAYGIGERFSCYKDGLEALEGLQAADRFPDIILLDINMPVMDGWEFLDAFGSLPAPQRSGTRIFLVSSSIAYSDRKRASMYPLLSGHLIKPLTRASAEELLKG